MSLAAAGLGNENADSHQKPFVYWPQHETLIQGTWLLYQLQKGVFTPYFPLRERCTYDIGNRRLVEARPYHEVYLNIRRTSKIVISKEREQCPLCQRVKESANEGTSIVS